MAPRQIKLIYAFHRVEAAHCFQFIAMLTDIISVAMSWCSRAVSLRTNAEILLDLALE